MAHKIDLENWKRKQHFEFFKDFDNPFFNLVTNVDCTNLLTVTKEYKLSSFISYVYLSLKAAVETEEFKYRIVNGEVVVHDSLSAGSTVLLEDETFVFVYFNYDTDFIRFHDTALQKIEAAKRDKTLQPGEENGPVIHYSTIPWISFSGLQHARHYKLKDSVPKIVFGKIFDEGDRRKLPVSIDVHHALMDGYHVGKYLELFQKYLNEFKP